MAPLHRAWLVIAMVVLNAAVIPAAAWGIAEIMPMSSKYVPGLVLATVGAGSAASLKAAQLAKGAGLPLAVSVVVVLQLVNIVTVPLCAGQVVTGASISAWDIVRSLLLLVLLPLVVGLLARARYADHAKAWQPELVKVANLAMRGRAGHGHLGELEHDRVDVRVVGDRHRDRHRHRRRCPGPAVGPPARRLERGPDLQWPSAQLSQKSPK